MALQIRNSDSIHERVYMSCRSCAGGAERAGAAIWAVHVAQGRRRAAAAGADQQLLREASAARGGPPG